MLLSRRDVIKLFSAGPMLLGALSARASTAPKLVIVGGGIGGAAMAKYMRILNSSIQITLVEPNPSYIFCPGSNEVLNDSVPIQDLTVTYDTLRQRYDIKILQDRATTIDYSRKRLHTAQGEKLPYDWLVVSTGPDFVCEAVDGYNPQLAQGDFPHAWKAGPQTLKLKKLYQNMPAGGTVVISAPPMPYRCPPAPYERASFMAEWLKIHNPTAKILILDSKSNFTLQPHYEAFWREHFNYGTPQAMIEWVGSHAGGTVQTLDAANRTVITSAGERIKADVINIIPPERASAFARNNDLNLGQAWVPIHPYDFRSQKDPAVFVIGDTSEASPMVKTGYMASNQAKWVAQIIHAEITGKDPGYPLWTNNCVAMAGEDFGMTITATFRFHKGRIELQQTLQSPLQDNPQLHALRASVARNWQRTFRRDIFE